eukprot:601419-Amphidinium_carterae.1
MGEGRLLPPAAVEVNPGTMIVVGSKEYLIGRKLGGGGFGSGLWTVKLSGSIGDGIGADGYLNVDLKLAAMAVEAAVAAEVRRATRDEVTKWEGKVFLPVLHSVGKVASVGGTNARSMAAIVMEKADGTLRKKSLDGEALSRVAWALASTLSALNRA